MGLLTNVSAPYSAHLLLLSTLRIISTNPDSAWSHVRTLPLKVLTELLARYLGQVGKLAQEYAEVGGRTTPNLEDATEALRHVNVSVETLKDFVTSVSNVENMESMDGKARRAYETELERADRLREAGSFLSSAYTFLCVKDFTLKGQNRFASREYRAVCETSLSGSDR